MKKEERKNGQRGSVVVEATISLTFFMFFIYALLSVSQIAYAQERVAVAADVTAKEIAEYSNVYFLSGADQYFTGKGGKSSEIANKIADNDITKFLEEIASSLGGTFVGDIANTAAGALKSFQGDSLATLFENIVSEKIGEKLLESNLKTTNGDVEAFKKRYHIEGDFDLHSSAMFGQGDAGTSGNTDVFLVVDYQIKLPILELFHIELNFNMRHCSYTHAWAETK